MVPRQSWWLVQSEWPHYCEVAWRRSWPPNHFHFSFKQVGSVPSVSVASHFAVRTVIVIGPHTASHFSTWLQTQYLALPPPPWRNVFATSGAMKWSQCSYAFLSRSWVIMLDTLRPHLVGPTCSIQLDNSQTWNSTIQGSCGEKRKAKDQQQSPFFAIPPEEDTGMAVRLVMSKDESTTHTRASVTVLSQRIVSSSTWYKNATAKRAASKTRALEISPTPESAEKAGDWVVLAWAVAQ